MTRTARDANALAIEAPALRTHSPDAILRDWIRAADRNAETDGDRSDLWALIECLTVSASAA